MITIANQANAEGKQTKRANKNKTEAAQMLDRKVEEVVMKTVSRGR